MLTRITKRWEMVVAEFEQAIRDQKRAIRSNGESSYNDGWLTVFEDGASFAKAQKSNTLRFAVTKKGHPEFLFEVLSQMLTKEKAQLKELAGRDTILNDAVLVEFGQGRVDGLKEWREELSHAIRTGYYPGIVIQKLDDGLREESMINKNGEKRVLFVGREYA